MKKIMFVLFFVLVINLAANAQNSRLLGAWTSGKWGFNFSGNEFILISADGSPFWKGTFTLKKTSRKVNENDCLTITRLEEFKNGKWVNAKKVSVEIIFKFTEDEQRVVFVALGLFKEVFDGTYLSRDYINGLDDENTKEVLLKIFKSQD